MDKKLILRKMIYLLTAGLLLINAPLYSQKTFTLDEAIETALKNNTSTKLAKLEIQKANAMVDEAFGYAMPSVDFSAGFTHFLEKPKMPFPDFEALLGNSVYDVLFKEGVIPEDNSKFKPIGNALQSFALSNSYEATAQVSQVLFNSAVFTGIGSSKKYLNTSQQQYRSTVANTILNVKKAFYGALLTRELLEITRSSLENAQENLSNVKALQAQGIVAEFDAMRAEVQVENIRPIVLQMENTYKNTLDGLKMVLGIDPTEEIDVEGSLEFNSEDIPGNSDAISKAMRRNFDIKTLENKKEIDQAFIELEEAGYWPTIAAFGSYSFMGQSDSFDFLNYRQALVGLSFSINLFQGNRTKNKVQQKTIEKMKTQEQIFQLKDFVSSQVKSKILELKRVKSNIEAQERNVKLAQKAYEISAIRYKEGTGSQLDILNADMALRQAKTNKMQSVYDYISAQSELDKLLGNVDDKYLNQ